MRDLYELYNSYGVCSVSGGSWRFGRYALSGRRIAAAAFLASGSSGIPCRFGRVMRDSLASCKRPERSGSGRVGGSDCGRFVRSVGGESTQAAHVDGRGPRSGSDCRGGLAPQPADSGVNGSASFVAEVNGTHIADADTRR
jgi:hypothetical protein